MNREIHEEPFSGQGWEKPTEEPELSTWRRFIRQVTEDLRYLKNPS